MLRTFSPIYTRQYFEYDINVSKEDPKIYRVAKYLLENKDRSPRKNNRFIKQNFDCIKVFLNLIPASELVELYNEIPILDNYWSEDIINLLITRNKKNLRIKWNQNFEEELIDATNFININWNFGINLFKKRLNKLLNKLDLDGQFTSESFLVKR